MGNGCSRILDRAPTNDSDSDEYDEAEEEEESTTEATQSPINNVATSPSTAKSATQTKGAVSGTTTTGAITPLPQPPTGSSTNNGRAPSLTGGTSSPAAATTPPAAGSATKTAPSNPLFPALRIDKDAPPPDPSRKRSGPTPTPPAASPVAAQAPRRNLAEFDQPVEPPNAKRAQAHTGDGAAATAGAVQVASPLRTIVGSPQNSDSVAPVNTREGPQPASPSSDPWTDDFCSQLPRRLQNKAIRCVTLSTSSCSVPQPFVLQPPVLFGALGDMRGERVAHPTPTFDLRRLTHAAPVVLAYRLMHLMSTTMEATRNKDDAPKRSTVGYGSYVKEPVFAMIMSGPPLLEQPHSTHRTQTQRQVLQRVGMYASSLWMPSTLRKGNRRRQRSQFVFQREILAVLTHGPDPAACFVANLLPDVLVNLQNFDSNVRSTMAASIRATLHKLYDVLVARHEKQQELLSSSAGHFGQSEYHSSGGNGATTLRAPRVDVSMIYLRDDALYATTTVGAAEGQLFCLAESSGSNVVSLESDSHTDSEHSVDDKSISSAASFMSSSSNSRNGRPPKEIKRRYDMPTVTTFYCQLSDFAEAVKSPNNQAFPTLSDTSNPIMTGSVRMATFSRQTSMASMNQQANASATSIPEVKPKFAIVLSTEAFWATLTKKEVWDLLFMLNELEFEAATRRSVEKTPSDIVRMIDSSLPDSTQTKLVKFYKERAEAHYGDLPPMPEPLMAQFLAEVAEGKAMIENMDHAARMSVTVISVR